MLLEKPVLAEAEWQTLALRHRTRAEKWTVPYRSRRAQGKMHPIYDFLFIYYRFAPALLENWSPGTELALQASEIPEGFNEKFYSLKDDQLFLDTTKLDAKTEKRQRWSLNLCRATQSRPAQFGCFGMHEWAMVYKGGPEGRARHEGTLPMRLSQVEINAIVESAPICCSHFDAFRFFTDSAMPFNRIQPTQDSRMENEQSGCLHTNMDLYKWTAKCMPWVGSELLWDTFEYAIKCREIDMRASPYDCSKLGYEPILIETPEGRSEYEREQRALSLAAQPLRNRLIQRLETILS
jgi:hypothetical protein